MLLQRYPQLLTLSLAQALYWSCSIIGIALTGLAGQRLTPWPLLATLPLTLLVAGNLLSIGLLARWMQHFGRARGLQYGALLGMAAGLLAAWAVAHAQFAWFCAAMVLLGAYQASAGFYRFAALDGMDVLHKGRAAAIVLAGGIAAALLAPSLAIYTSSALPTPMVGAYLAIAALALLACALLQCLPAQLKAPAPTSSKTSAASKISRSALWQRPAIRQAIVLSACGHGLMILVMNATPLAMHDAGHSLATSTHVIQWHVLGMFLPSLLAGFAVDRFGARRIAWLGALLLVASALIALTGLQVMPFLVSSLLLGAGWNLMILAGTTLLSQSSTPQEAQQAQPLMEWVNNGSAAAMSLSCGMLIQTLGWNAVNAVMLLVLLGLAVSLFGRPAVQS
ncbi:MFS transporter [Lampropedia puyangensis]|uniref:MFS transporter n=1 Tax=Lampropedia puyangensis TaxID=1330072 RepID=A0A4S8F6U7_9BURK|nr:MFS transporter [Lampropedia puyangensis]THU02819.1 MFS transporter [Lampropedia puyangensis]